MSFQEEMASAKKLVENRLGEFFTEPGLEEAMRYSLMAGGKRIRPILTVKFCEAAGGDAEEALDFACGVEMLHTYSLIHDDLPCMDNDDLRRGMPTNHRKFGECTAVIAGDALQAAALRTVLNCDNYGALMAGRILSEAAGETGMCIGQYIDTIKCGEKNTEEELTEISRLKTGAIIRAACMMGVAAAMGSKSVDVSCMSAARGYAENLGLAFQIRDDILDAVSSTEELGKPVGSDEENDKCTFVSLLGIEECKKRVIEYTEKAKACLYEGRWKGSTEFLTMLADSLAERKY